MEAKEKAKDLIIKFIGHCSYIDLLNTNTLDSVLLNNAKQCALISVEEILSVAYDNWLMKVDTGHPFLIYWNEVKEEIHKL
jgi:hypothetical protein